MAVRVLLVLLCVVSAACSAPLRTARLDPLGAPSAIEIDAANRARDRRCSPSVAVAMPAVGPWCLGRTEESALLAGLASLEIAGGLAVAATTEPQTHTFRDGGRTVPWTALQDIWIYSASRSMLDLRLAQWKPYTPQDQLRDMVAAPFNVRVLARPDVWGGTLALLGGAAALTAATSRPGPQRPRGDPDFFGVTVDPALGPPLWAATGTVFFEHVAIAEEALFRGVIQSDLVRATGSEWGGWALASAAFGAIHATNALALPPAERLGYVAVAVPWITLTGSWLGVVYKRSGYSLAPPIAIHFWYDVILSAVAFAARPDSHLFSARIALPMGPRW